MSEKDFMFGLSLPAKKVVEAYLQVPTADGFDFAKMDEAHVLMSSAKEEFPYILRAVMQSGKVRASFFAATVCCGTAREFPDFGTHYPSVLKEAEAIIDIAIRNAKNEDEVWEYCILASSTGGVPASLSKTLRGMIKGESESVRFAAANALAWIPEHRSRAFPVLSEALRGENVTWACIAGNTLLQCQIQREEVIRRYMDLFASGDEEIQGAVAVRFAQAGTDAIDALEQLDAVLFSDEKPAWLRARVAETIGSVTKGNPRGASLLSRALKIRNWQILNGVMEGMVLNGRANSRIVARIADLLTSEDPEIRLVVVTGLQRMGDHTQVALPRMLELVEREKDTRVSLALYNGFATVGVPAVQPLLDMLRVMDFRLIGPIAVCLKAVADHAIEPLVETLKNESDEQVLMVNLHVLSTFGPKAAPALPVLREWLIQTTDLQTALFIIRTIHGCGPAAEPALDAVAECLIKFDDPYLVETCIQILRGIPDSALSHLSKLNAPVGSVARDRLDRAIKACQPSFSEEFEKLSKLNRDDLLKLFVLVGEEFEKGAIGWRNVASRVKDKITFSRSDGKRFGATANSISARVQQLGKLLGVELIEQKERHSGCLTPNGIRLLRDTRKYLTAKYGDSLESS